MWTDAGLMIPVREQVPRFSARHGSCDFCKIYLMGK